jgi:hypothetical protein
VGLSVSNLQQATDFYTIIMGFQQAFTLPEMDGRPLTNYLQVWMDLSLHLVSSP